MNIQGAETETDRETQRETQRETERETQRLAVRLRAEDAKLQREPAGALL